MHCEIIFILLFHFLQDWWYHVHIYPTLMKLLSLFCVFATMVILWSESTFQYSVYPPLSVPAFILRNQDTGYIALEVMNKKKDCAGSIIWKELSLSSFTHAKLFSPFCPIVCLDLFYPLHGNLRILFSLQSPIF